MVGVFVVAPPDSLKGLYPRLRQLIDGLHAMSKSFLADQEHTAEILSPPHSNGFLLHCCAKTKKYPTYSNVLYSHEGTIVVSYCSL